MRKSAGSGALLPPATPIPDFWLIGDSGHFQDTGRTTLATANGDPIGSATDSATTGPFHPSQATGANQPTLATNVYKGHSGIAYSATQNLTHAAAPLANSRAKGTLMVAFRSDTYSPPGGAVFSTTQDQLGILSDGRGTFNTADVDYGTLASGAKSAMLSPVGGQLMALVYDGSQTGNANRLKLYRNLVNGVLQQETLTFTGTVQATTLAGGQGLFLGREAGGSGWAHTEMEVIFWRNVALTDPQLAAWGASYLALKFFTKTTSQLVVQGDSNAVGSPNNTGNPWPARVTTAKGWVTVSNNSTVGFKLAQGSAALNLDKRDDWYAHQPYILALGTNDLAVDHASLATLQGYINTAVTKLTAGRYPIFVLTIPESVTNITGADETTRTGFNSWLLGLAGITAVDIATALGSSTGANFEGDNLHLSNAGHDVVKNTLLTAFTAAGY